MNRDRRLNFAEKLYQQSIWEKVSLVAKGVKLEGPLVVELDPTTFCDFTCPECISGHLLNKGRFTTERLLTLVQEFVDVGVKAVVLIGGGEPLAHPATNKIIQILGENGIAIGVTTNGTLIDRYLEILSVYSCWTRISVDAGTAETYGKFRPHRSGRNIFDKVINNMKLLSKHKKHSLGYSFLLMSHLDFTGNVVETNYHEVLHAGLLAREIGCDYFEIKPMYDMNHFLIPQPKELLESLKIQIEKIGEVESENFQLIYPSTLLCVKDQKNNIEPKEYSRCLISELRTLVTPNGVYICPYYRGDIKKNYGDPITNSFAELWISERRKMIMDKTHPSDECHFHCVRHKSNLELISIEKKGPQREIIEDYDLFI